MILVRLLNAGAVGRLRSLKIIVYQKTFGFYELRLHSLVSGVTIGPSESI